MRKRFKKKKHSCALCKPNKMGWEKRWSTKDLTRLEDFEKEKQEILRIMVQEKI